MLCFSDKSEIIIIAGKIIEKIRPLLRLPPMASVIHPIRVGPAVHPISPATARNANIAVDAFGIFLVVRLIVPGHMADTEKPQIAQPISAITGEDERQAIRYEIMHSIADTIRYFLISIFSLNLLKIILPVPISTAKAIGPARSPTVFETPSAVSAKDDAHWLIASSAAPEQTIRITAIMKNLFLKRFSFLVFLFSSSGSIIGTRLKNMPFKRAKMQNAKERKRQLSLPKNAKNILETAITITVPQQ